MPKVPCVEYIQATSNDAALLQIRSGQADWTHNFVPNVEKAYIAKDPLHFHAFYDNTAYAQSLMFDTGQYPYSLPAFRKAVSMAIDRVKVYEARRVRLLAAGRRRRPELPVPDVGHGPGGQGRGEARSRPTTRPRPRRC